MIKPSPSSLALAACLFTVAVGPVGAAPRGPARGAPPSQPALDPEPSSPQPGRLNCGNYPGYGGVDESGKFETRQVDYKDTLTTVLSTQRTLCQKDTDPELRAKTVRARAAWMKRLGLSESDMNDMGPLMDSNVLEPFDWNSPYDPTNVRISGLSPVDELRWVQKSIRSEMQNVNGWLDSLPDGVHEPARILFLEACEFTMRGYADSESTDLKTTFRYVTWALCADDFKQLSRAKLDEDLKASNAAPEVRFVLRTRLGRLQDLLPAVETEMRAAAAKDPQIQRIIYDVPAKAAKDWAAEEPQYQKLFHDVLAIEDAFRTNSRKALEGCHDRIFPWWKKVVGKLDTANREKWEQAMQGSLSAAYVARGLALCDGQDDTNDAVRYFGIKLLQALGEPTVRGVHGAIYLAVATEARNAKFDDRTVHSAKGRGGSRGPTRASGGGGGGYGIPSFHSQLPLGGNVIRERPQMTTKEAVEGVIKSVSTADGTIKITFAKKTYQGTVCTNWVETDKIAWITDGGYLHYRQECTAHAPKTYDATPPPITIAAFLGDGVKVGNRMVFDQPRDSGGPTMPILVMSGEKVVAYLGVAR